MPRAEAPRRGTCGLRLRLGSALLCLLGITPCHADWRFVDVSAGAGARIENVVSVVNVAFGPAAKVSGATDLRNGTIASSKEDPAAVGAGVLAKNFIILSGSQVADGAVLANTFVGQGVRIGKQYSAENSTFFANCEGFHGEACSIFAGPYTVSHHKSTLMIAGMFSFYNAGSGTNQSNHMYKLGPIHQGILLRGAKTG